MFSNVEETLPAVVTGEDASRRREVVCESEQRQAWVTSGGTAERVEIHPDWQHSHDVD